jgi:Transglycosylase-like domain
MRQHPLLAFATAVSTISIALLGAVGGAGAATVGHPSARSTPTSRSTLAAGSALTLPITLAPPLTLTSSIATRHNKPALKASKRSKHDTRGRLDVKGSKDVLVKAEQHLFVPLGGVWSQLRSCESGGNYSADTGNGYYGAYQFALSTWRGLQLAGLPSSAPPQIQDDAAIRLQRLDGWDPWPRCSWALGLKA